MSDWKDLLDGPDWHQAELRTINGRLVFGTRAALDRMESDQCLIKTGDEGYPVDPVFWEMVNEELK